MLVWLKIRALNLKISILFYITVRLKNRKHNIHMTSNYLTILIREINNTLLKQKNIGSDLPLV
jgi:hypothetical protein